MGYDYNVTDAEVLKQKLCNCQTESNNVHNSSISIMSSIYDKLHKNTIKKYPDNYQLNKEPEKWIDTIDSILNNFKTKMEQLSEEDTVQGATFNDSVSALDTAGNATATGTESGVIGGTTEELNASGSYDVTGESSTVVGDETIEDLNTSASVAGNGQASTVTGEESIEILEETNSGSGSAQASTVGKPNVYTVNTESGNLNVRDASGSVITSIPKDSTVKVIGEADGNGYVEVEYDNGKTGYVYQDYLKETPATQAQTTFESFEGVVDTQNTGLNIRTSPTSENNSNIIGSLEKGSNINIVGEEGDWYKIALDDGSEAYVSKQFITRR